MFKMLCSFGGKILPRPVDGAPRYAGGHTRIISVPRRSSFPEFYDKMAAVYGGSPVAIRYHVPDEELDVLISVSSSEDLENMMCEYDKLGDGSAGRLRVFLFSVVENEIYGYWMNDGGKKYVEAINGVVSGEKQEGIDSGDGFRASIGEASRDPSRVSFLGTVNSETKCKKGFTTNSITNVSPMVPFLSVGLLNSQCRSHNQGTVKKKAYVDENQDVERVSVHFTQNENYKDFSETVEDSYMPFLPPLIELQECSLQDGKIVQKPLLHAHSFEPSCSTFSGHHSEDITALQSQHRENMVKPKLENIINLDQLDVSWMNRNSADFSKRGNFDEPNANKFDHSKSKLSLNSTGLSGDSEQLTCRDLSQHYYKDIYLRLQQEHRGKNFNVDKHCHLPTTIDLPNSYHNFYGGSSTPPQPVYDNSWQQKMVEPAEMFNHASFFRRPGIYSPPSHSMNTSGMFFSTSQLNHESSLQQHPEQQQQLNHESSLQHPQQQQFQPGATSPFAFEIKEDAIQNQLGQVSSSMENREYQGQPSMNIFAQENFDDYLHVLEFDQRLSEKINPSIANHHIVSKDMVREISSLIGEQNRGRRPQNGANLSIGRQLGQVSSSLENREYQAQPPMNNFVQENFHGYVKPVDGMMESLHVLDFKNMRLNEKINPAVANHHIVSKDVKTGTSSLVGEPSHGTRPQNGANMFIGMQLGQVSSSMENREYQGQPSINTFVQENVHGHVKPVDGMTESHVLDFDKMRLNENINSAAANRIISKMEISSVVGEPNRGTGSQNGANLFDEYKVLDRPGIVPECFSVRVNNPLVSNTGFTMDLNPKISSVVGEGRSTMRPHNSADILPTRNSFFNSGILPELATNVNLTPASVLNHHLLSQIFEQDVEPRITVCPTEYDYDISINMSLNEQLKYETPLVHHKEYLYNDTAASFQRGSVPYPYSNSIFIPWNMKQLCMTCSSDSQFCYQDPCGRCPQSPSILGDRESDVWEDTFYDEFCSKFPDMVVQLKEGALQPAVDALNNNSPPSPLFKSLRKYPPASCSPASNESSSTFPNWIGSCEGMRSSNSIVVPQADDIGPLQIIKNVDLQELQELGSGNFGTVFYGKWRGSEVAIKRINNRCFSGKPSDQERMRTVFWNEASKLSDLHHPNVLAFYGIVLDGPGGNFATVTEYMVNGSLRNALLCNQNTFDHRKRLLIATDVALGMEYLHRKNIVHFDLKSDNLLINLRDPQRPICKVGDFGLSKVKGKTIISGGGRGTLLWMAPELLNGSSNLVSEKVDVFSFGIVMWELLTGQEPYADLHFGAIIGGIVNNTLRPPVPEFCDPDWRELMERCWSAEPSARPSFTQIAHSLSFMEAALS